MMGPKERIELIEEIILLSKVDEKALLCGIEHLCISKSEETNTGEGFVKELKDVMFESYIKHKYPNAPVIKKYYCNKTDWETELSELNIQMDELNKRITQL